MLHREQYNRILKISIQNSMTPALLKIDDRRKNSGIVRARHPRQVHPLVCPPLDDRAPPRISVPILTDLVPPSSPFFPNTFKLTTLVPLSRPILAPPPSCQ